MTEDESGILTPETIFDIGSQFYKNFSIVEKLPELPEFLLAQKNLTTSIQKLEYRARIERIFEIIESRAITDSDGIVCVPIAKRRIVDRKVIEEQAEWWIAIRRIE